MAEIHRFSSRRQRLDRSFLAKRLKGAKSYKRIADRVEVRFTNVTSAELPAAALAESPIYRGGEQLQPWQRAFVALFLKHRETYGKTRLLLADDVGLGKTLSLAASAMLAVLLDDGPVLILCPATLTLQWQVELRDKLGIPSAVWLSAKKIWVDDHRHLIKTRGPADITRCPCRIALVSTGLIIHDSDERRLLLERKFGTVVLDEAHKARRLGALGEQSGAPNNLLAFRLRIGPRTKNPLLGTATPIQTEVSELWDLMRILNAGADFVLGRDMLSHWADWHKALPMVQGTERPIDERDAWEWLRNPLPPGDEESTLASLRLQLGIPANVFFTDKGFGSLGFFERQTILQTNEPVAVYAGTGKSSIFRGNTFTSVDRDDIKKAVKQRDIRLVVATDAACEGLNLQTLGTLINVDLPWNPSRLEQRLGRIKRFGQARSTVDMLNLVYHDTQDEKVYPVLSRRLKDKFDIFGGLPDTIEDDWIESVEKLEAMMNQYIHLRQKGRDVFELRDKETIDPDKNRWELCSRVLARKDVVEKLSESW